MYVLNISESMYYRQNDLYMREQGMAFCEALNLTIYYGKASVLLILVSLASRSYHTLSRIKKYFTPYKITWVKARLKLQNWEHLLHLS